jgi:hypothetical protein
MRRGDPLAIWRGFATHKTFDLSKHLNEHDAVSPFTIGVDDEATRICCQAAKDVFLIPDFDDRQGLTDNELIGLMKQFFSYSMSLKKSFSRLQTELQHTDMPSSISTQLSTHDMPLHSVSTSTLPDQSIDKAESSPTAQERHSVPMS